MSQVIIYYDAKCKHCIHFAYKHTIKKDGSKSKKTVAFCNNDRSFLYNEKLFIKSGDFGVAASGYDFAVDKNEKVTVKRKFLHYLYGTFITGGKYRLPMSKTVMDVPDQTDWGIKHYMKHGFGNNHVCLMIGYPESNLAYDEPYDKTKETERNTSPCLRVLDTKIIRDDDGIEKVNVEAYFRSWDLYAGMPENLGGIGMWQQYVAYALGIEPGILGFTSIKAHVYGSRIKALAMRAGDFDLEARFMKVLKDHGVDYNEIPDCE
jgi:hypothetical protein